MVVMFLYEPIKRILGFHWEPPILETWSLSGYISSMVVTGNRRLSELGLRLAILAILERAIQPEVPFC
jgi:hypothetical protein